jgi:tetratricopeptide (TPR) repeat protein
MKFYSGFAPVLFGVSIALVQSQIATAQSSADVAKIAKQITVLIDSENPGSGIIIKRDGTTYTVLTAAHVVRKSENKYEIVTPDDKRYLLKYTTVKLLPETDLAVLQFTSNQTYNVAKIGNSEQSTEGTIAYVAGFPIAKSKSISRSIYNFTEGKITANASQPLNDGYGLVYSNLTLPGMSGGPVLNAKGEIIGIHGKGDDTDNFKTNDINPNIRFKSGFNLGISINTSLRLLPKVGVDVGINAPQARIATSPKADDFFIRGVDKEKKGDFKGAIASYSQAISLRPKYADAYYHRGVVLFSIRDEQKALKDFQKAADLFFEQGNNADGYKNQGAVRLISKDYQGAITSLTKAIELKPNDADIYNGRGIARYKLGDKQGASADYTQAINLNPNFAFPYGNRGAVRIELGNLQGAFEDFNEAIRLAPKFADIYFARGFLRGLQGDKKNAIADLNQAIRFAPSNAHTYLYQGLKYGWEREKKRAIGDLQKAADLFRQKGDTENSQAALSLIILLQR